MTQPNWRSLVSNVVVSAKPAGLWTKVVDFVAGPRRLKIVARAGATWNLSAGRATGPDGDRAQTVAGLEASTSMPAKPLLFPAALAGSLIGKIGGGAADNTAPVVSPAGAVPAVGVSTPFPVSAFGTVAVTAQVEGPLYLTMNDCVSNFDEHSGEIVVDIFEAV
jgi:hypothetical protein